MKSISAWSSFLGTCCEFCGRLKPDDSGLKSNALGVDGDMGFVVGIDWVSKALNRGFTSASELLFGADTNV